MQGIQALFWKLSNLNVICSLRKFRLSTPLLLALALRALLPGLSAAQQPPSPPPATPSQPAAGEDNSKKQLHKIPPFVILGTVFTEKNLAFPGVQVRIRRKGEKKFRFETHTNSRGEFAIRVPDGIEYEVVVTQKKYKELSQEVAANSQDVQKRVTFKMEPAGPTK